MDNIQKETQALVQDAYNTSFYNDSLSHLATIAEQYKDNPAQLEVEGSAYISGLSSELDSADTERITAPLIEVKNAYVKQATENFGQQQLDNASKQTIHDVFVSKSMAEQASEEGTPDTVQATLAANFFSDVDAAVQSKRLSIKDAIQLRDDYTRNLVISNYGSISRDPRISTEQKLKWRQKFIDGQTGEETIDKMMTPEDRLNAVLKIESSNNELELREARMKKAIDDQLEDTIEGQMASLLKQKISGKLVGKQYDAAKQSLMMQAKTPEQIKKIEQMDDLFDITPDTKLRMSEAEQNGTANEAFYWGLWNEGFIPTETYIQKVEGLSNSLHTSLNSSKGEQIKNRMKSVFNYDNMGKNEAYNVAWSAYSDYLANLDHVATSEEHEAAYKQAMEVAKAFPGDTINYDERQQKIDFYSEAGLPYYTVDNEYTNSLVDVSRQLKTSNFNEEEQKDLIYSKLYDRIYKKTNSKNKTNIIIDRYKKIKGE